MPHVCGDEPVEDATRAATVEVCPTYVGMNRFSENGFCRCRSMPHVCGDEPYAVKSADYLHGYAPRMWG